MASGQFQVSSFRFLSCSSLSGQSAAAQLALPVILLSGVNEIPAGAAHVDLFLSKLEGPAVQCERLAGILERTQKARLG